MVLENILYESNNSHKDKGSILVVEPTFIYLFFYVHINIAT